MSRICLLVSIAVLALPAFGERWILPDRPAHSHPRLIETDEALARLKQDPARVEAARAAAEPYLSKTRTEAWPDYFVPLPHAVMPPRHTGYDWPYWTPLGAELRMELEALSFGYTMTGDRRFLDRARTLMLSLSEWPRWTDADSCSHGRFPCLDTYYITTGMAVAYDYLYDALPTGERTRIRDAIARNGLQFIYAATGDPESFVQLPERWPNANAMVNSALGIAALALWGDLPKAPRYLERAIEKCRLFLADEAHPDGGLVEGFFYGAASMEPMTLFFGALRQNAGIDLLARPYFRHAADFPLYFLIPGSDWLAGFGDNGGPQGTQPVLQGTVALLLSEGLADAHAAWYLQRAMAVPEARPDYLEAIQRGMFYALRHTSPYREVWPQTVAALRSAPPQTLAKDFASIGWVALRSGWNRDDELLAFRCGPSVGHSHRDQNDFILAARGQVLASDPGYQRFDMKYPNQPDRNITRQEHEFTYGSIGHNVILVDGEGQQQAAGTPLGFFDSRDFAWTAGDAAAAYPGLHQFIRQVLEFRSPGYFVVFDQVVTDGKTRRIDWLLHTPPPARSESEGPRRLRIVNGSAALIADFPLLDTAWKPRAYPQSEKFGHTIAATLSGEDVPFLSVFQVRGSAEPPAFQPRVRSVDGKGRFVLEAAGDTVLLNANAVGSISVDDLTSDGAVAFLRRAEGDRIRGYGILNGSILQAGDRPLVVASAPVRVAFTNVTGEPALDVAVKAPVTLTCRVPAFRSLSRDGLALGARQFQYDQAAGTLRLSVPAGTHRFVLHGGAR